MLLVVIEICLIIIYRLYINKKVFPDDEIVRLVLGDSKLYFLYYSPVNSFIPGLSVQGMLNLLFHFIALIVLTNKLTFEKLFILFTVTLKCILN